MKSIIAFATAAILSTAAFAADPAAPDRPAQRAGVGNQQPADAAARPAGARESADSSASSQNPDQMFIKDAISDNLLEVQLGQIAQDKATDDQVKQFGQQMVKDHTQALTQLRQIAKSANVQADDQLNPVCQAKLQEMQKLPADAFTRKYAIGQYAHHVMDVLEFTYQSQNAQQPELKQFANQTLPKLRQHEEHAQQIAMAQAGASGGDTARPAGARIHKSGGDHDADKTGTGDTATQRNGKAAGGTSDRPAKGDNAGGADATDAPAGNGRAQ